MEEERGEAGNGLHTGEDDKVESRLPLDFRENTGENSASSLTIDKRTASSAEARDEPFEFARIERSYDYFYRIMCQTKEMEREPIEPFLVKVFAGLPQADTPVKGRGTK